MLCGPFIYLREISKLISPKRKIHFTTFIIFIHRKYARWFRSRPHWLRYAQCQRPPRERKANRVDSKINKPTCNNRASFLIFPPTRILFFLDFCKSEAKMMNGKLKCRVARSWPHSRSCSNPSSKTQLKSFEERSNSFKMLAYIFLLYTINSYVCRSQFYFI